MSAAWRCQHSLLGADQQASARRGDLRFARIASRQTARGTSGMGDLGRILVFVGGLLLVIGIILIFAGKINLPIGRLPGDIVYRGKNTTFYFPLMTSILLSVIFSLVLYFVNRMRCRPRTMSREPQLFSLSS